MTDRELLEMAAKASGLELRWPSELDSDVGPRTWPALETWNPLTDDGDALRLAVKLRMLIEPCRTMSGKFVEVHVYPSGRGDCAAGGPFGEDDMAATRRAIVRAAAAIGKGMA